MVSPAIRISLIYFLIGAVWIGGSDWLLWVLVGGNTELFAGAQTFKGWAFMGVTGVILYLLLQREFNARRQHDERFQKLFATSPVPTWVYDRETLAFLDVNEAACTQYGYSRDEFLAMRITEIRPPEEIPQLLEYLSKMSAEYRTTDRWHHRTKSGQVMDIESSAHTIDFDGKPAVLVAAQNVTERNRAEAERFETARMRVELEKEAELHNIRKGFVSMVSHEFRRPMTTITTSVELLEHYRDRMTDDAAQKHFVRIHEQLNEMQELLNDFLTLMRAESAEQDFKPTAVELTDLCRKLVETARLSHSNSHIVRFQCDCERIQVMGNEKLLRQAIGNLLSNAIKYSPEGGEVELSLRHTDTIEIRVSDKGIGIPADDQVHLFDPFYRASNVGEMTGTGLGLPIAKRGIEVHQGTLTLAKSDGSGTEFLITLPVDERTILTGC